MGSSEPPADTSKPTLRAQAAQWLTHSWVWRAGEGHLPGRDLLGVLLSPVFLGLAPYFAKLAYRNGAATATVIAMRMLLAAGVLWLIYLLFARKYIRSWWLGVSISALAGVINGLGSICYYQGLARIDASLASILNVTYLVFVTLILRIMGQHISRLTVARLGLALAAVYLLTNSGRGTVDLLGVGLLLLGALAYAVQLVIGQRVLYDIPAPTMTLYSVSAMALVVTIAWLFNGGPEVASLNPAGWKALLAFAGVTALSRLTLFLGVKRMGSVQTATLGVSEVLVTLLLAMVFLGESLSALQWAGAGLMVVSVGLLVRERDLPKLVPIPFMAWAIKVSMRFQRK